MHTHFQARKRAFTIIELLTVISIIGLLTGLAATSYVNAQKNARDNARKTNVNNIATAVESYYKVNQAFPGLIGDKTAERPIAANYDAWKGCLAYDDSMDSIVYYYYPTVSGGVGAAQECGSTGRSAVPVAGFNPADYQPSSSWIPNLGAYLNPIPVEKRYQGPTGGLAETMDSTGGTYGSDALRTSGNIARTLFYRHLPGGYMAYTRLENGSTDTVSNGTVYSDQPQLCGTYNAATGLCSGASIQVSTNNIYMVRR